jgi:structure-specific recognition protein 1
LAGRNEVAVEFALPTGDANDAAVKPGSTKNRGRKAAAGPDELVEMRFYIPGTAVKKEKAEGAEGEGEGEGEEEENDEGVEEQNAANLFYETLMDKAEIGDVAGDTFATFLDVLHLTPRGRFDIDMYESSFRLRGKTYDYKIQYSAIKKFFLLPKNDDTHTLIVLGLDPPLRQGQTRYPFLVMQLKLDEEISLELNMTESVPSTRRPIKLANNPKGTSCRVSTRISCSRITKSRSTRLSPRSSGACPERRSSCHPRTLSGQLPLPPHQYLVLTNSQPPWSPRCQVFYQGKRGSFVLPR